MGVRPKGLKRASLNCKVTVTTPRQGTMVVRVMKLDRIIRVKVNPLYPILDSEEGALGTPKEDAWTVRFHLLHRTLRRQKRTKRQANVYPYSPICRVLNPFLSWACPSSNLFRGFWAETLQIWRKICPKTVKMWAGQLRTVPCARPQLFLADTYPPPPPPQPCMGGGQPRNPIPRTGPQEQ